MQINVLDSAGGGLTGPVSVPLAGSRVRFAEN